MKLLPSSEFRPDKMGRRAPAPLVRASVRAVQASGETDRTVNYVFSDNSVARDMHVIEANAWQLANFKRNPVFLWAHDSEAPPIGQVILIHTVGNELRGTVKYAERDEYDFADTVFRLVKGGFLNATSVSWLPIKWKASTDRSRPGGIDFTEAELLEVSQVPVPALPTALKDARAIGIDTSPFVAWAERALDGASQLPRRELEMIRSAASAPHLFSAPDPGFTERRRKARAAAAIAGRAGAFASFGDFLQAVARQGAGHFGSDTRLSRGPTGANETDPTAGGFLVPDEYSDELIGSLYEEAVIAPLCDRRETDKPNNARLPAIDETSRADGSRYGGILSYWAAEGVSPNTTLPKFKSLNFSAKKLIALCVATDELLADVPLLDGHIRRAFAAEASFQLDKSILIGTGVGVPLGVVNSLGTIVVPKQNGQAAASFQAENIDNMWARLPAPARRRAVWIGNEDVETLIGGMGLASDAATAGMYFPAGANGNEFPLIKGRPLLIAEQCPAVGKVGDLILGDFSQYIIIDGGLKSALSLDVDFNSDQGVFRFVLRVDGRPAWSTPITPYNGTQTRSAFVTLAAR